MFFSLKKKKEKEIWQTLYHQECAAPRMCKKPCRQKKKKGYNTRLEISKRNYSVECKVCGLAPNNERTDDMQRCYNDGMRRALDEELGTARPSVPRPCAFTKTYCIRLHACTSISSILYEFNSSFIRCARAGVSRLHVAGSLLRSYTVDEKVSYTDRLSANTSFLGIAEPEVERWESVAGAVGIVDRAGADEFGSEKRVPW